MKVAGLQRAPLAPTVADATPLGRAGGGGRAPRLWLLALCWLLAACTTGGAPAPTSSSSAGATPSGTGRPTASAGGSPSQRGEPGQGRPLQEVPDVRPTGLTDPPPGEGLARYARQELDWQPCRDGLRCATVLVPLDYNEPDTTALTLSLAMKPATASKRRGALFLNPGGPGGSGVEMVQGFDHQGLEGYDLVGWDPRGVGESTPVQCARGAELEAHLTIDVSPDDSRERTALLADARNFGASCLAESGPLLTHVSTIETARDLDLLRQLVGDPKLNYLGFSYGTQIGATYAHLHGAKVGRMVLDGAVDITSKSVSQELGFERALGAFAEWCASERCRLGSTRTEVIEAITGLWQRLDRRPLAVGSRKLNQTLGVAGVVFVLYFDQRSWPYLEAALDEAIDSKNGKPLLTFADEFLRRRDEGEYGQLNYSFPAVRCLDSPDSSVAEAEQEWAEARTEAPSVGPYFGPDVTCPLWPVPPVQQRGSLTAPDAPPIVVVGSTQDPATPYEWAVAMAKQLRSGVLITREGAGHTGYSASDCVRRLVQAYLVDGKVPRDGSTC